MMLVATISRLWEVEDSMLLNKPVREPGQDLRDVPTYTIPEAGEYLGIHPWTLLDWYSGRDPILKPSYWYGPSQSFALLTYRDLEEVYKIHLLRTNYRKSLQYLRRAMQDARNRTGSEHPLLTHKFIVLECLALDEPAKGRRARRVTPLGEDRSLYIPEVADLWGERIVFDRTGKAKQMFPWRFGGKHRPVSLDPEVMSGRLVVTGTRIPVRVLWKRSTNGESPERIAEDYGLAPDIVKKAIAHFDQEMQG